MMMSKTCSNDPPCASRLSMTLQDTAPPRHVSPLDSAFNFRDLGGLPTSHGRFTRRGLLFRSDSLQALSERDVATLADDYRLKFVIDLRLALEVAEEGRGPLEKCGGIGYVNAPLEMASTEGVDPEQVLESLYRRCLESASLVQAVEHIAACAGQPTLFHCAAGKDRTGVVAAMVLSLLGVDEDVVVADYLASAHNMPRILERFATWPRYREHFAAMPTQVYAVDARPIRLFLAELRDRHRTARDWAIGNGMAPSKVDHFLRMTLE